MKPLYTEIEYKLAKSTDWLSCKCYICEKPFKRMKKDITRAILGTRADIQTCSVKCRRQKFSTITIVNCANCKKSIKKHPRTIKKNKNVFCSRSCNATYNNKNKTSGNRRSKLEVWLENKLLNLYPNLIILFNHKEIIGSELDIYIPSLKLAFELNGVFHYEPIFGENKLNQIQNNDANKFQKCQEKSINLCIIDTSTLKYFKEQNAYRFLNIIIKIINNSI